MPKIVKKSRVTKGKMARELVYYCIWALTAALARARPSAGSCCSCL